MRMALCDSMDSGLPGSSVWNFRGKMLGELCISYSGTFLTQGQNPVSLALQQADSFTTTPPGKNTEGEGSNSQDKNYTFPQRVHFKA